MSNHDSRKPHRWASPDSRAGLSVSEDTAGKLGVTLLSMDYCTAPEIDRFVALPIGATPTRRPIGSREAKRATHQSDLYAGGSTYQCCTNAVSLRFPCFPKQAMLSRSVPSARTRCMSPARCPGSVRSLHVMVLLPRYKWLVILARTSTGMLNPTSCGFQMLTTTTYYSSQHRPESVMAREISHIENDVFIQRTRRRVAVR